MHNFQCAFRPGDYVHIDGEKSIRAAVTAVMIKDYDKSLVRCEWLHNGCMQAAEVEAFRLALAENKSSS